eukprot:c14383_g1_i1 orf=2-283(+)
MGWFVCLGPRKQNGKSLRKLGFAKESQPTIPSVPQPSVTSSRDELTSKPSLDSKEEGILKDDGTKCTAAQTFEFQELAAATKNFRSECLLGEG